MFGIFNNNDAAAKLSALDRSQAVIEFKPDGTILTANQNFLGAVDYSLEEIQGQHHRMFVEPEYARSAEYAQFWKTLQSGKFEVAEYKRFGKGGKEIWIQASYNPILDRKGRVVKVVKFATDITADKLKNADYQGQLAAISKSQAVIEFNLDGTIITANPNFLGAVGYELGEIQGKHHSMFVDTAYKNSGEYREFWEKLRRGEYQAAEYKRYGKGGKEIWIQASYNPIMDMNGKPFKVVKYATDVTAQVLGRMRKEKAQKEIETNLSAIESAVGEANSQSMSASSASVQTTANVNSVASGAEELNASVREISESMAKSRTAADAAFDKTMLADEATKRLTLAAKSMGGIVELIQGIGGKINLLALNATIESARAGDAGKGFAVVANEVKNLAKQATDATEQIAKEIDTMQSISDDVASSLGAIRGSIEGVREYVTSTAAAVEEQSAVAREMSRNMQQAATAVASISDSISAIAGATNKANQSSHCVKEAVTTLAG